MSILLLGLRAGEGKYGKTPWMVQVQQVSVEADATVDAIADSDSIGGGTDGKGLILGASYAFMPAATLGVTYYDQSTPIEDGVVYKRSHIDLSYKF
jgi:hypothetical protein